MLLDMFQENVVEHSLGAINEEFQIPEARLSNFKRESLHAT